MLIIFTQKSFNFSAYFYTQSEDSQEGTDEDADNSKNNQVAQVEDNREENDENSDDFENSLACRYYAVEFRTYEEEGCDPEYSISSYTRLYGNGKPEMSLENDFVTIYNYDGYIKQTYGYDGFSDDNIKNIKEYDNNDNLVKEIDYSPGP